MKYQIIFIALIYFSNFDVCSAQQVIPIIKANSPKVSIKDGNEGITKFWNHLKKTKSPIVYNLAKNQSIRPVTFFTDIDSITTQISTNSLFPIKIILANKDTCDVILSTQTPNYSITNEKKLGSYIIPFKLNANKQIIVKAAINGNKEMDFVFDLGARYLYLIGKDFDKTNNLNLDGRIEDESVTGLSTESTSSKNTLEIGHLKFNDLPVCYINEPGFLGSGGGLIGYNLFQGRVLEIDFDNEQLIIHDELPDKAKNYSHTSLMQTTGGLYIPVTINNGKKECTGWYFFDTGADFELSIDSKFGTKENLFNTMSKNGTVGIASSGANVLQVDKLKAPLIKIANFELKDVPVLLGKESYAESKIEDGVIGIGLQKRFNLIIDFPNGKIYLKANHFFKDSFKKKDNIEFIFVPIIVFTLLLLFLAYRKIKKRKSVV